MKGTAWKRPTAKNIFFAIEGFAKAVVFSPAQESSDREWVAVDGGTGRACRGKSAGDNLASYFTVHSVGASDGFSVEGSQKQVDHIYLTCWEA